VDAQESIRPDNPLLSARNRLITPHIAWATLGLAVALLLLRFSISQMDVPTRQSYPVAVASPDERCAASGVTGWSAHWARRFRPCWRRP
jgi:hypothetical protein